MSLFNNLKTIFGNKNSNTQPSEEDQPKQTSTPKKILIVEDEALLANALEEKFKQAGFEVFKAANGQIGLEMAISNKPNIPN